jgi:hypothetical protein
MPLEYSKGKDCLKIMNLLIIFESKILRKIYGPLMEKAIWRNRYDELNEII